MNPSDENLYSMIQQTYLPAHWQIPVPSQGLPRKLLVCPLDLPLLAVPDQGNPALGGKLRQNPGSLLLCWNSPGCCLNASSEFWAVGEKAVVHSLVIWRLFLIVLIHSEVLDFSVTCSCVSRVLWQVTRNVTCNMFILCLCWGFFVILPISPLQTSRFSLFCFLVMNVSVWGCFFFPEPRSLSQLTFQGWLC